MGTPPFLAAFEVYPPLRAVCPPEAPFDGALARSPGGGVVLLVDSAALTEWAGWASAPGRHLLAPLDLLRRDDGHAVVLPSVSTRLDRLVARREAAGLALTDGERVTLAVSVLRGCVAAVEDGIDEQPAAWWTTPDGEPLLVTDRDEAHTVRAASAELLRSVADAENDALARAIADIAETVGERRLVERSDALEDAVFATVPAEPIVVETVSVRAPAVRPAEVETAAAASPAGWWSAPARAWDAGWADAAAAALARVRSVVRLPGGRRRPLLVAAGIAGVVLAAGALWPQEGDPAVAGAVPEPSVGVTAPMDDAGSDPAASVGAQPAVAPPPADTDPREALETLLRMRDGCADRACWPGTQEDPAEDLGAGALTAPGRTVELLDDLGGVAVLRVNAEGAAPRLVTVIATPDGWRIRDAFDAADPG